MRNVTIEERFWSKVEKTDDCWLWTACKDKDGYGFFRLAGKNLKAHRFVLELSGVTIPKGKYVCHTCDIPSCVNPLHLWIGDNSQNQIDAAKKGRHSHQKISANDAAIIRQRRANGETGAALAREYGLSSNAYIRNIVVGRKWKHVN